VQERRDANDEEDGSEWLDRKLLWAAARADERTKRDMAREARHRAGGNSGSSSKRRTQIQTLLDPANSLFGGGDENERAG